MEFTDSHCHLQFGKYFPRAEEIIAGATKNGVSRMICVGTTLEDSEKAARLASRYDYIWATAGVHPHDAESFNNDPKSQEKLIGLLKNPEVVAVGETGLDYYRMHSEKAAQKNALVKQLEAALLEKMPVIFHVRDAWDDFWPIFDEHSDIRGVVHSFSAGQKELDGIIERGLFVGLNGIMTFTQDESQLEVAKSVPLDKLLLETDAPFLTPKPYRGKVCEPKHVKNVAEFLAELRGEELEQLVRATTANTQKLFSL